MEKVQNVLILVEEGTDMVHLIMKLSKEYKYIQQGPPNLFFDGIMKAKSILWVKSIRFEKVMSCVCCFSFALLNVISGEDYSHNSITRMNPKAGLWVEQILVMGTTLFFIRCKRCCLIMINKFDPNWKINNKIKMNYIWLQKWFLMCRSIETKSANKIVIIIIIITHGFHFYYIYIVKMPKKGCEIAQSVKAEKREGQFRRKKCQR